MPVIHGSVETVGYRFRAPGARSVAYFSDVKEIPAETMEMIRGVDVMIVDALRPTPHPTHFSTSEALGAISDAEAAEGWLTHLGHEVAHSELEGSLPHGVKVAWDGLRIVL